jgi:hypothetical protein
MRAELSGHGDTGGRVSVTFAHHTAEDGAKKSGVFHGVILPILKTHLLVRIRKRGF